MIKSLFLKFGLLSLTLGIVFWARWAPQPPSQEISFSTEKPVGVSQHAELNEHKRQTAAPSTQTGQKPLLNIVTQTESSTAPIHTRLDLNRASVGELESLPGIGTVLAQRVIAFRESVGRFQQIEDLRAVKGIGAKKFERIKPFVMVSTSTVHVGTEQRIL